MAPHDIATGLEQGVEAAREWVPHVMAAGGHSSKGDTQGVSESVWKDSNSKIRHVRHQKALLPHQNTMQC